MIDIHSHILPGIDDGAESLDEAVEMLRMAAADGITHIVATPHANAHYSYDRAAVEELGNALRGECPPGIRIHCGCDFHLSLENIRDAVANPWRYVIGETAYILVEFPEFVNVQAMDRVLEDLIARGLIPIITHPERHPVLQRQPGVLKTWAERDCLVQITAQSILGDFGRTARHSAEDMLRNGVVSFVASDAHDTRRRPPLLSHAYEQVNRRYGAEFAHSLFTGNPSKVLEGAAVSTTKPTRRFMGLRY